MDPAQAIALKALLEDQQVAALATLHDGEPAVSMVPYALLPRGEGFIVHVSRLATHTADMLAHPSVGLLVVAPPASAASPQELRRASIRGLARPCIDGSPEHAAARALYLARFPQSEQMFGFSDFSVFLVEPRSVRFVAGFGQASSILAEELSSIMGPSLLRSGQNAP